MPSKLFLLLLSGSCLFAAALCGHAQTIQDGGFELNGYPTNNATLGSGTVITANGWTFNTEGGTGHVDWQTPGSNGITGHHIDISSTGGSNRAYAETIMSGLIAGASYALLFDLSAGPSVDLQTTGSDSVAVFLNGSGISSATYTPNGTWVTQAPLVFTATGFFETVRFRENSIGGATTFNLDAVSVQAATPEPNSLAAGLLIIVGIAFVERRRIRSNVLGPVRHFFKGQRSISPDR